MIGWIERRWHVYYSFEFVIAIRYELAEFSIYMVILRSFAVTTNREVYTCSLYDVYSFSLSVSAGLPPPSRWTRCSVPGFAKRRSISSSVFPVVYCNHSSASNHYEPESSYDVPQGT
jgi:hypothetical protein